MAQPAGTGCYHVVRVSAANYALAKWVGGGACAAPGLHFGSRPPCVIFYTGNHHGGKPFGQWRGRALALPRHLETRLQWNRPSKFQNKFQPGTPNAPNGCTGFALRLRHAWLVEKKNAGSSVGSSGIGRTAVTSAIHAGDYNFQRALLTVLFIFGSAADRLPPRFCRNTNRSGRSSLRPCWCASRNFAPASHCPQ